MTATYLPMLRYYRQPWWLALSLPVTALSYLLMTVDSAVQHYRGAARPGRAAPTRARTPRSTSADRSLPASHFLPGVQFMPHPYTRSTVRCGLTPRSGTR